MKYPKPQDIVAKTRIILRGTIVLWTAISGSLWFVRPAWANAFIPFLYAGFDIFLIILVLPLLVIGEASLLYYMRRSDGEKGILIVVRASTNANLLSASLGLFFLPFIYIVFKWIADSLGIPSNPTIIMRRLFLASYIATIPIEAIAYHLVWAEKKFSFPVNKFWVWSFLVNTVSYGIIGWMFSLGWLTEESAAPSIWYLLNTFKRIG